MRVLRGSLVILTLATAAWSAWVVISGGFDSSIAGVRLSSRDPVRPLGIALAAMAAYVWLAGPRRTREHLERVRRHLTARRVAAALAFAIFVISLAKNEWTAGGSDAYAYVSEADGWLRGQLRVAVPVAADAPWPNALQTFAPLGYRPAPDDAAIVPIVAPGLPLMMALLKAIGGHCAAFWVAPIDAGLLVWFTFLLGRRIESDRLGLAAAWLVATSPTVLAMAKATMSDVPTAAAWALAIIGALGSSPAAAIGAGASASMAILIRPNLVPLAAIVGAWMLWRDLSTRPRHVTRTLLFAASVVPGCLLVAWFNNELYGSPLASGYGDLGEVFSLAHVPTNARQYSWWIVETQTPLFLLGALALALPFRALWPTRDARRAALLLAGTIAVVWASYLPYVPFDAWWFLRFLLPCWPALCVGTAVTVFRAGEHAGRAGRAASVVTMLLVGLFGAYQAVARGVYPPGEGERRYVTIAELVMRATDRRSVVLTAQHSGSIRYYAGRLTLKFDVLDPDWLDEAVDWLERDGRAPVILLEDWELPLFRERFARANRLGSLPLVPVLAYRAHRIPGMVYLFDPRRPAGPTRQPTPTPDPQPTCAPPATEVP